MQQLNTESKKPIVDSSPLFASVLLALFHSLRDYYSSRTEDMSDKVNYPATDLD